MAFTLSAAWKKACLRNGAELRHLIDIYDGTTHWKAVDGVCTDATVLTIDPAVRRIDAIAAEFDPETRITEINRLTMTVDDSWIRPIMSANRMKGMRVTIALGEKTLAESEFEIYFTGIIQDTAPQPFGNTVLLDALDVWSIVKDTDIVGAWANAHPLEVIEDIYDNRLGLDAAYWDATSLDPSDSANVNNSHLVVTRVGSPTIPWMPDLTVSEPKSAKALVRELLEVIDGVQVPGASGKLTVKIFDPSAAAVAHWDDDEIEVLEQLEDWDNMINQVTIKGPFSYVYDQNDTDSQSNHAYGVISSHIVTKAIDNKWVQSGVAQIGQTGNSDTWYGIIAGTTEFTVLMGLTMSGFRDHYPQASQPADAQPFSTIVDAQDETNYDNSPTTEGTFSGGTGHAASDVITMADGTTVTVDAVAAGVVTEFTVDNTSADGSTPVGFAVAQSSTTGSGINFSLTPDADNVTELRPLYLLISSESGLKKEVIKITTQPVHVDRGIYTYYDPNTGGNQAEVISRLVTVRCQRAQLGTSAQSFAVGAWIIDITPYVFMGNHLLDRFGDAAPKIRVVTSLNQFDVEVADLVTIDWAAFLAYDADGIDNTTKWQVLSKSVDKDSDSPSIEWTMLRAVAGTSTRTHGQWHNQLNGEFERATRARFANNESAGVPRVTKGQANVLGVEDGTGLNVRVNSGHIVDGYADYNYDDFDPVPVTASKDSYIFADLVIGGIVIKETTNGGDRPITSLGQVPLAKVVTDGSDVTDLIDLTAENQGTVKGDMVSLNNLASASDYTNSGFGDW